MKKTVFSFLFIAASAAYVIYLHFTVAENIPVQIQQPVQSAINNAGGTAAPSAETGTPAASPAAAAAQNTSSPAATHAPVSKPAGAYADGAYTGGAANAYYGIVQVRAVISNGAITNVNFLQYPSDRLTSQFINSYAMPILESEAIRAQSAAVDGVSGATDTSQAFRQSLGDALAQAKQ